MILNIFARAYLPTACLFWWSVLKSFVHFLIGFFEFWEFFLFWLQVFCQVRDVQIFSLNLYLVFSFSVFHTAQVFNFDEIYFINLFFSCLWTLRLTPIHKAFLSSPLLQVWQFYVLHLDLGWVKFYITDEVYIHFQFAGLWINNFLFDKVSAEIVVVPDGTHSLRPSFLLRLKQKSFSMY